MAALRPCPFGLVMGTPRLRIGIPSHVRISGRQSISLLKTSGGWGRTTATAPGLRRSPATRANNGAADWSVFPDPDDDKPMSQEDFNKFREELKKHCALDKDMPFREDIEKIDEYENKMTSWNTSIFHMEATQFSLYLCMIARSGVKMASRIMDCAVLRLHKKDEISLDTTKQIMAMYVSLFVKLVEGAYHKKFHVDSMFSLIGAFRGVAAISHILLEDALASIKHAQDISSKFYFAHDKDNGWSDFEKDMNNLEDKFRAVSKSTESYKLLRPTMDGAMILTLFFVSKMNGRRKIVLGKHPGASPHCADGKC